MKHRKYVKCRVVKSKSLAVCGDKYDKSPIVQLLRRCVDLEILLQAQNAGQGAA